MSGLLSYDGVDQAIVGKLKMRLNANLMELTTKSASLILLASGVVRCACTRIPYACSLGFVCIVACSSVF